MITLSIEVQRFASFLGAAAIAVIGFWLSRGITLQRDTTRRLADFAETSQQDIFERVGSRLVDRLGLSLTAWKNNLFWAQLGGHYPGMRAGGMLGRMLLFTLLALGYVAITDAPPILWSVVILALVFIPARVSSRAQDTRREVKRQLPEIASLIAAETAAGASAEQAVERAMQFPGELSELLRSAVAETKQAGKPLFSRESLKGVLLMRFERIGLPALISFASQLDLVASMGVEAPHMMASVAKLFATEYLAEVRTAAEQLENNLLIPVVFFFFIPFVISLLLPLMVSIFEAL